MNALAVATLTLPDLHATVTPNGDTFVLWWTDYVANEWTETHPNLGTALARLTVLHHCVTHGEGFDVEPDDFTPVAAAFLDSSMTAPQPASSVGESLPSKGGRRWAWFGR